MTRAFLRASKLYILLGGTVSLFLLFVAILSGLAGIISNAESFSVTFVALTAATATGLVPMFRYADAVRCRDKGRRVKADVTGFEYTVFKLGLFGKREPYAVDRNWLKLRTLEQMDWKRLVWRDEDGNEGRSEYVRRESLAGRKVGDKLVVYVDPEDPSISYWEEDVGEWGLRHNSTALTHPPGTYPRRKRISFLRLFFRWNGVVSGLFGIVMVAAGLTLMLPLWLTTSRDAERLEAEGVWGTARIVSRHISGSGSKRSYWLTYRVDAPRAAIPSKRSVDRVNYEASPPGTEFSLYYWPYDPSVNELSEGATASEARVHFIGGLFSTGLGAFSVFWLFVRTRRVLALRDSVLPEEAVVLSPDGWLRRAFSDRHLRWRTQAGKKGRSMTPLNKTDRLKFPPGSRILVYVDPRKPKRSYWDADIGSPPET